MKERGGRKRDGNEGKTAALIRQLIRRVSECNLGETLNLDLPIFISFFSFSFPSTYTSPSGIANQPIQYVFFTGEVGDKECWAYQQSEHVVHFNLFNSFLAFIYLPVTAGMCVFLLMYM